MNVCDNCPDCNISIGPCQDLFGSNATPEGGILGRVDAVYTSIEAQTSTGSLHAHSQVVVQCLHPHTCLFDMLNKLRRHPGIVIKEHLQHKAHVSRQVYETSADISESNLE